MPEEYEVLCANCDEKVPTEDAAQVHIIDFEVWEMAKELCSSCQAELTVMEVKDLAE